MMQKNTMSGTISHNRIKYGRLYNSYAMIDPREISPIGYHIPTLTEINALITYSNTNFGTSLNGAKALASTNYNTYTTVGSIGKDKELNNYLGFSALPSGIRILNGATASIGANGYYWTKTAGVSPNTYQGYVFYYNDNVIYTGIYSGEYGFAIRCIKDNNTPTVGGIAYDIDGNQYDEVVIGDQIWLAQSLAVTKYRNGDPIPDAPSILEWSTAISGVRCDYDNNISNVFI